jgi:hypothetical protein
VPVGRYIGLAEDPVGVEAEGNVWVGDGVTT